MNLILPLNHHELNEDEMSYIDGGEWVSQSKAREILAKAAMSPSTAIAAAVAITVATKAIQKIKLAFGGFWGWIAGVALGAAGSQAVALLKALGTAALYGGRHITWSWNVLNFGVNY